MRPILLFVSIFSFFGLSLIWSESGDPVCTILYSSSLNGNLDGCTCKSNPRAGLVKRAFFIKNQINRENSILIDTGDILDVMPDKLQAEYIFAAYTELGYDAIGVGDQEFLNGFDTLLNYRKTFSLISHNLYVCPNKTRCVVFSLKPLIIKKKEITMGIFSLFDPDLVRFFKKSTKDQIKVEDPVVVAQNMIVLIKDYKVDIIILLYHGYYENAVNLVREVKGIDLVVLGHEQLLIDMEKEEETYIVSPGKEGNRLGMVNVYTQKNAGYVFKNSFKIFDYYTDPDDESIREKIEEYYKQMMVE